ncbi:MAG: hypothetical protein ABIR79_16960 [Candidatus Binatia bacterium]
MTRLAAIVLVLAMLVGRWAVAAEPAADVVRYEDGRLTVRATDAPLDRVLGQIAAVTGATMRGAMPSRTASFDFTALTLSDGLTRILGAESFMLTYSGDGTIRTIDLLGRGAAPPPSPRPSGAARPPLADEEAQAAVLQQPVAVSGPLRRALGSSTPAVGRVLHAVTLEHRTTVRAAAREAALGAFVRDPAIEAAYLSTLVPVDDATLARMLRATAAEGAAEEWMAALAARAPSPALREKATAVLAALKESPPR